jgi:GTP-binding protein EngB required for normal cell division
MDIRREPGPDEYGLLEWLRGIEVPAELILTKADKLGGGERSRRLGQIERQFAGHAPLERPPRLFSAVTGLGRAELIADLIDSGLLTSGLAENV